MRTLLGVASIGWLIIILIYSPLVHIPRRRHVELDGVAQFPFSRGVSFYEINDEGRIIFARDIVEPALKPGSAALGGISLVAPLVRRLGPAADPANVPFAALGMAVFYAGYIFYVLVSPNAPGLPAWQTSPETLKAVLHESLNFFYVNIALAALHLNPVPSVAEHPVDEALFNFVNAWSLMMLPTWVADPKSFRVPNKFAIWIGTLFLTNVFLPMYMTLRLVPTPQEGENEPSTGLPWYSPLVGGVALAVGVVSVAWAAAARPEYGDLVDRVQYLRDHASSDRVFWAFCVDAGLYSVWQAWLLGAAGARPLQRFVPFLGMTHWLLTTKGDEVGENKI